mmetsp:Transcript_45970/g.111360  ORF Transcript_45970/g.111360 Transcript_45970/m.111360 type:complete len:111 (-) Transcript_45970:152-484(-)
MGFASGFGNSQSNCAEPYNQSQQQTLPITAYTNANLGRPHEEKAKTLVYYCLLYERNDCWLTKTIPLLIPRISVHKEHLQYKQTSYFIHLSKLKTQHQQQDTEQQSMRQE